MCLGRPGGTRGGRIPRFAEAESDFGICISATGSNTAEPGKGLAVFNRSAHSAGPGHGKEVKKEMGKWEMGDGILRKSAIKWGNVKSQKRALGTYMGGSSEAQ